MNVTWYMTDVRFIAISKEPTTLIFVKDFFSPWLKTAVNCPVTALFIEIISEIEKKAFQTSELTGK